MMNKTADPIYSVLDPLSKATQTLLRSVRLYETDYLLVKLDDKRENFIVQSTAFKLANGEETEEIRYINEEKMVYDL